MPYNKNRITKVTTGTSVHEQNLDIEVEGIEGGVTIGSHVNQLVGSIQLFQQQPTLSDEAAWQVENLSSLLGTGEESV